MCTILFAFGTLALWIWTLLIYESNVCERFTNCENLGGLLVVLAVLVVGVCGGFRYWWFAFVVVGIYSNEFGADQAAVPG